MSVRMSCQDFFSKPWKPDLQTAIKFRSTQKEMQSSKLAEETFVASTSLGEKVQTCAHYTLFLLAAYFVASRAFKSTFAPLNRYTALLPKYTFTALKTTAYMYVARAVAQKIVLAFSQEKIMYAVKRTEKRNNQTVKEAKKTKSFHHTLKDTPLTDARRTQEFLDLIKSDSLYMVRRVTIKRDGNAYDAFLVGHKSTIKNGKWALEGFGNGQIGGEILCGIAARNKKLGLNTLIVNGPKVGRSCTAPLTAYNMGGAQEAALQFLETVVKAKKIVLKSYCFGVAAQSKAILMHSFKKGIQYLAIRDRGFDKLSNIAAGRSKWGRIVKWAFYLLGLELDNLKAADKLASLGIRQIVIQASNDYHANYLTGKRLDKENFAPFPNFHDGVIDGDESFAHGLVQRWDKKKLQKHTTFLGHVGGKEIIEGKSLPAHNFPLHVIPSKVNEILKTEIKRFLS